ncbi:MAG TPA: undecaprenyl-diphosphate phosphatase [Dongiaceae bacterium]|nr:undecaprenyl-diphosphate phosphatase [Dongiaceae bacterium]
MDWLFLCKAFLLGIIEGLTEFLPISSTGHLIVIGSWLEFDSGTGKVFEVVIQLGAILAVVWLYRMKIIALLQGMLKGNVADLRFAGCVLLAFFPAVIIGVMAIDFIKQVLFNPLVVAIALIVGGVILMLAERHATEAKIPRIEDITWLRALGIGIAQCFAMIPGTSRSGSTIVGGLLAGLSRQAATEFSFFLAMPTMLGAAVYDGYKHRDLLNQDHLVLIAIGFVAAFITALLVVQALVKFVANHSFRVFAWYRIALGSLILILLGFNFSFSTAG